MSHGNNANANANRNNSGGVNGNANANNGKRKGGVSKAAWIVPLAVVGGLALMAFILWVMVRSFQLSCTDDVGGCIAGWLGLGK